eukprot:gene28811-30366_t
MTAFALEFAHAPGTFDFVADAAASLRDDMQQLWPEKRALLTAVFVAGMGAGAFVVSLRSCVAGQRAGRTPKAKQQEAPPTQEEVLSSFESMGFSKERAEEALAKSGGDVERALPVRFT